MKAYDVWIKRNERQYCHLENVYGDDKFVDLRTTKTIGVI